MPKTKKFRELSRRQQNRRLLLYAKKDEKIRSKRTFSFQKAMMIGKIILI